MISPYALLRLTWRPLTLLQLFLLTVLFPVISIVQPYHATMGALWRGGAPAEARLLLWQSLVFIPGYVALLLGWYRLELQHAMLSWTLPRVREQLLMGAFTVAVPLAVWAAVLLERNSDLATALAGFALALLAFALGWFLYDVVIAWQLRSIAAAVLIVAAFVPAPHARFAESQPWLTFVLALPAAVWLLWSTASPQLARRRPFIPWYFDSSSGASFFAEPATTARRWAHSLATERIAPWLRAAMYESSTSFPRSHLLHAAITVVIAVWLNSPYFLTLFLASWMMSTGVQLSRSIVYPVSRAQLARVSYTGMLIDATALIGGAALLLPIARVIPWPMFPIPEFADRADEVISVGTWALALAASFAMAPIAQWGRITWPQTGRRRANAARSWALFFRYLIYLAGVGMTVWTVQNSAWVDGDALRATVLTAAFVVVVQLINWFLLRTHYTTSDLVPQRS